MRFKFIYILLVLAGGYSARGQNIYNFAGNDSMGCSTIGVPAVSSALAMPLPLRVDAAGNVYFPDYSCPRILKVTPASIITVAAGNGSVGHSGDGGLATDASIALSNFPVPTGFDIDLSGNIYIAEATSGYKYIRKVDASGHISTLYTFDSSGFSGDGGPASAATVGGAFDLTVDASGNLFLADWNNNRIRKINTAGIISTYAGSSTWGYSGDGGSATSAEIANPQFITVDHHGNVYFDDQYSEVVRKVGTDGIISTVAGRFSPTSDTDGVPATASGLNQPFGIAFNDEGEMYICEWAGRIRKVDTAGIISTIAGHWNSYSGDGGPATAAGINQPAGIGVDGSGKIYFSDFGNNHVRMIAPVGTGVANVTKTGIQNDLRLWPNPNEGTFSININAEENEPAQVTITNVMGQIVNEAMIPTNTDKELKPDVPPGIYFITVTAGLQTNYGKIVVR